MALNQCRALPGLCCAELCTYTAAVRILLVLAITAVLGGCWASDVPAKPFRTKAQRLKDAEMAVSKTPVPRTYRLPSGELQVIDLPTADSSGWLNMQRCFLWRDLEFKQSSLSCEPPHEVGDRPPEQPEPR